ncbi:hypothetical protein AZL_d02180 (plasmid) [Azospirillum sp. B510]|uniref:hypothetical protein n=1 Tax=Azospirillum sp. (strain B510) TaxID=137722 RepID=UPI0001C4C695|nr:hypothetical protein [Azospirillum sp. B510]BAI76044.1 hypothetical protein AZL_d02180 [Azospirillum sp. B510]
MLTGRSLSAYAAASSSRWTRRLLLSACAVLSTGLPAFGTVEPLATTAPVSVAELPTPPAPIRAAELMAPDRPKPAKARTQPVATKPPATRSATSPDALNGDPQAAEAKSAAVKAARAARIAEARAADEQIMNSRAADSRPVEGQTACADHEPASQPVLDALFGGDAAFAELARRSPAEAFRCSSLFPGDAALAALRDAVPLAPFDAIGAADQLGTRPGGEEVIARALDLGLLTRSLDGGMPFYETRHELRKRLPKPDLRTLESHAARALAASLARDPAAVAPKIGALLDDMVDDPPDDRFRITMALSSEDLVGLIARTGPQLYTSSLDGLINVLRIQLKLEKRSFLELAREERTRPLWAEFFVATVGGGRAASLFGTNPAIARELMRASLRALLPADGKPSAIDTAAVIGALADAMDLDSLPIRAALEDELAAWYRAGGEPPAKAAIQQVAVRSGIGETPTRSGIGETPTRSGIGETPTRSGIGETPTRSMIGLAGSLHAARLSGRTATPAFEAERFLQHHPLAALPVLNGQRLFRNGINVQRMTFYDDPDGRASFRGFLRQHRAKGWALHGQSGFAIAISPERNGHRIIIVADIPGAGEAGRAAAWDWMAREGLTPSIVIHRGHSYHEDATMTEIAPGTALVFWGSCGGHTRLRATLERAPDALVLATQNIGVSTVNEALLGIMEERLLTDGAIDWDAVWKEARGRIRDRRFASYKRPDQDSANLAFRAWQVQATSH